MLDTTALAGAAGGVTGGTTPLRASTPRRSSPPSRDPSKFFKDAKKVGDEKVGDIETEHITGTLDVAKALDAAKRCPAGRRLDHDGRSRPPRRRSSTDAFKDPKVDVWIGKDDRVVHRLAFKLNGDFSNVSADAQGVKGLAVDLDATMLPADSPTITPPANAKSSQELLARCSAASVPALGLGALPTATG